MSLRSTGLGIALGVVLGAVSTVVGLAQAGRLNPERPELVVALGQQLEVVHRKADLLLERGDVPGAIAALEQVRSLPWPSHREGGDTGVQLRHDAYGRLLRVRLDHPTVDPKPPEDLLAIASEGLGPEAEAIDVNLFTARLVALQGEIYELMQRDDDALRVYESALEMNRVLLDQELESPP